MSCLGLWHWDRRQSRQSQFRVFLGSLLVLLGALWQPVAAQSGSNEPAIVVPSEIRVPPASVTRMQLVVTAPRNLSEGTILVFRGLPQRVMLSEGRRFSADVWAVPVASVGKLEIAPPIEASGSTEIAIELTTLDGRVLATAKTILSIGVPVSEQTKTVASTQQDETIVRTTGTINGANQPAEPRQNPGAPAVKRLPAEEVVRVRKLMERGDEALAAGKVTAARLLYQAAADVGWAAGAFALAQTYDGRVLSQSKVLGGVQPDAALARKWYEKAKELGLDEATARLQVLPGSR